MNAATPTPRTDAAAITEGYCHHQLVHVDFARQLERESIALPARLATLTQELSDCRGTLNNERHCHGQTVAQLKNAASQEIKAANDRATSAEKRLAERDSSVVAIFRSVLSEHWLSEIRCNHEDKTDQAFCACSKWSGGPPESSSGPPHAST